MSSSLYYEVGKYKNPDRFEKVLLVIGVLGLLLLLVDLDLVLDLLPFEVELLLLSKHLLLFVLWKPGLVDASSQLPFLRILFLFLR